MVLGHLSTTYLHHQQWHCINICLQLIQLLQFLDLQNRAVVIKSELALPQIKEQYRNNTMSGEMRNVLCKCSLLQKSLPGQILWSGRPPAPPTLQSIVLCHDQSESSSVFCCLLSHLKYLCHCPGTGTAPLYGLNRSRALIQISLWLSEHAVTLSSYIQQQLEWRYNFWSCKLTSAKLSQSWRGPLLGLSTISRPS